MFSSLLLTVDELIKEHEVSLSRMRVLEPLVDFIQLRVSNNEKIDLVFICTHNSRRSHLAQIWAQVAASYFKIPNVYCYSGGTVVTALHPMISGVLIEQGFSVFNVSEGANPINVVKYGENDFPIIGFSKVYDNSFNPVNGFAAVMTCSQADSGCPFILGADMRIPITYEDPKVSDGCTNQREVYFDRSLEIAREMFYVFSQIKNILCR